MLGFFPLEAWVGVADDAGARVQPCGIGRGEGAAQRHMQASVSLGVEPTDGARVPTSAAGFKFLDPREAGAGRQAAHGGCRVQGRGQIQDVPIGATGNGCLQVLHVAKCLDAADADDDGRLIITDPIFLLSWLFQAGSPPPPPTPSAPSYEAANCGLDPTDDPLACQLSPEKCN